MRQRLHCHTERLAIPPLSRGGHGQRCWTGRRWHAPPACQRSGFTNLSALDSLIVSTRFQHLPDPLYYHPHSAPSCGAIGYVPQATGRLRRNLAYFKVNYLVCMVVTTLLVMIMNPWSLLVLGGLAASWAYVFVIRTVPIMWGERALTYAPNQPHWHFYNAEAVFRMSLLTILGCFRDREKVMGMGGASVVVIFFLTR